MQADQVWFCCHINWIPWFCRFHWRTWTKTDISFDWLESQLFFSWAKIKIWFWAFRWPWTDQDGTGSVLILFASCQQIFMTHSVAVCTVKNSWWWTEELSETCRVLLQKMWEISASSWFHYKNFSRCTVTWTSNFSRKLNSSLSVLLRIEIFSVCHYSTICAINE